MVPRVIALSVAAVFLVIAPPALSHEHHYKTDITLREGQPGHYVGKVSSGISGCENHRRVTIYEKQPGPDAPLASQKTDGDGRYHFIIVAGSTYVVRAKTKTLESFQHKHICESGHSPTVED